MTSLRLKLTVALLGMSFVAIGVVGATARAVMLERFDDLVVDRAFQGFQSEIGDYYRAYGSLAAASVAEPFVDFVARTRPRVGVRTGGRPPPPGPGQGPAGSNGPDRPFEFGGAPPRFVVVNAKGEVLLSLAQFAVGEVVPDEMLNRGQPLMVDGREVGLAVTMVRPALTELEERYLSAIEDSWLLSLLFAGLLAVPLGLFLGGRLTEPLRDVTGAIGAMRGGELRQSVKVRSRDEVGLLAEAFNAMSSQLADAYENLEASHATISKQANLLAEMSRKDELTGLLNRRAFNELAQPMFSQARRYDQPLTFAMADIDRFKRINDQFSHATGDQVLQTVAEVLRGSLRDIDLVARYGGEEFVIAFPATSADQAVGLAERLRGLVGGYEWSEIHPDLRVTISMGLSDDTALASFEQMLEAADTRLYEAKEAGRDRVRY